MCRCGRLGYHGKNCKESVDPAFGEDEHWGADYASEEPIETKEDTGDEGAQDAIADEDTGDVADTGAQDTVENEHVRYNIYYYILKNMSFLLANFSFV